MKKNAMLKIAAILMVAVLLTTCAISSTFAKYVDNGEALQSNTAHVAHWGIDISATVGEGAKDEDGNIKLFLNAYGDTVEGASEAIVVAPGTTNASDAFKITVTGTPEVDYKLNVNTAVTLANWAADGYYCPLAVTVDGKTLYGNNFTSETAFADAIENAIAAAILGADPTMTSNGVYSQEFDALDPVPGTAADGVAVSWEWAFDDSGENKAKIDNAKDTILGNADTKATIAIQFSVSAEQID